MGTTTSTSRRKGELSGWGCPSMGSGSVVVGWASSDSVRVAT
jgi:hypothetical protein